MKKMGKRQVYLAASRAMSGDAVARKRLQSEGYATATLADLYRVLSDAFDGMSDAQQRADAKQLATELGSTPEALGI